MEQTINIEELVQDDHNLNKGTKDGQRLMERSFRELGAGRSILVDRDGRIIAGNKSQRAAMAAGIKKVRVIETTGDELIAVKRTDLSLDSKEGREMAYADNLTTQVNLAWDEIELEHVNTEVEGFDTSDWGFDAKQLAGFEPLVPNAVAESEDEAIERKKKEFDEKMAKGELDEDDPEYQEFLKKFEAKKTTDDCYTPEVVYEAVADWVANEYGLIRANFVRPFYPGGDYQKERYKKSDIVVDNPPFSIMAEILDFYNKNGIRYFLFGPSLTSLGTSYNRCTLISTGAQIIYANGANVCTSFLTNLDDEEVRVRTAPDLAANIEAVNPHEVRKTPKFNYDKHLIYAPLLHFMSRYGIDFRIMKSESEKVVQLDAMKEHNKEIFGGGYLVSDRLYEERLKADDVIAEHQKPIPFELSDRERAIIAQLSKK